MAYEFKLPDLGEGIHEGEIKKWLVKVGDRVKADQTIAELETDKAVVEMPAPKAGTILHVFGKEGEKIKVGQILIVIGQEGETYSAQGSAAPKAVEAPRVAPQVQQVQPVHTEAVQHTPVHQPVQPVVASHAMPRPQQIETFVTGVSQHALATPFVRKLARELGVDIEKVKGTGQQGRISEQDVRNAVGGRSSGLSDIISQSPVQQQYAQQATQPMQPTHTQHMKIPITIDGHVERVPFKGIRRTISEHMVTSFQTAVHVTHVDEVDVTELAKVRDREKAMAEASGIKLTYLAFVVKALVAALREFPVFNASLDEEKQEIVLKKYYNIGIAVDTEEGLMVPIIKDADKKTIMGIAQEIQELAEKARARKLALDQMKGGTCTITNIGSAGGIFATPIINYPEVSILGLYRIQDKVAVVKDEAEIRKMMNVSITFDHRVIDGAQAARFVTYIKKHIEDPGLLLIHE